MKEKSLNVNAFIFARLVLKSGSIRCMIETVNENYFLEGL